jgi:tetratricopeptide (TPR) repeat protein
MDRPFASIEVFCSYAEQDAPFLEQLEDHLSVLRRSGAILTWHRRKVIAGSDWEHELDHHLQTASLLLLLISPDFLASDYQYGVELQRAMQRHQTNEAHVIPIVVRPCDWKGALFEKLQIVPRNGKPVTSWRNRDEAFAEIAKEIRAALELMPRVTLSAPSTSLPKIWQIPYARNPVFTGRDDLLQMLTEILQTDHLAALAQPEAISGLGGIGKTQLAVEYAYRTASKYQAVFWVAAETQETLVSGYAGLAMTLNLPEKDEPEQHVIVQAVRRWLQTHTDWLLILDNADELSLVQPLLPPVAGGHIILTTRAQATGRFAHRIEIEILERDDGALLLLRRAGVLSAQGSLENAAEQEVTIARQISEELGDLPLALDQAGAYIEETRCSLLGYQQRYQERRTALLQWRGTLAIDHPEPVAATWSLSFEKVEQTNPTAAELLRFCAFLAPDAIAEEILTEGATELGPVLAPIAADAFLLNDAIVALRAYSLIARDPQTRMLTIHRLVQTVLRDNMATEMQRQWMQRAVSAVIAAFPSLEFANWPMLERLLPQALTCATWIKEARLATPEAARLLNHAGYYLHERARYTEAEFLYQLALQVTEQQLGAEHPEIASVLEGLASLYSKLRRYKEAEQLYERALRIRELTLGTEHLEVASVLNNLAILYREQKRYEKAELLYKRALNIREQVLEAGHPDVAYSLNGLARLYEEQERYEEAEFLYKRALKVREQSLGAEHPEVAYSLIGLANLYEKQRRYMEAELLYKQGLNIRESALGTEHPDVIYIKIKLASLGKLDWKYGGGGGGGDDYEEEEE